jgi:hypothetical protein
MPRVKRAIEAGFIGSAEAANAYMRQLLVVENDIEERMMNSQAALAIGKKT